MKRRKAGRTRKVGAREKNGRLDRNAEKVQNERFAKWQRRHLKGSVNPEQLLDPLCADPLGLLYVAEYLTEEQYNNGVSYREIARRYRVLNGLPSGLPKLMGVKGISHFEADEAVVKAVKARYLAYRLAITRSGGKEALDIVHMLCSMERMIQQNEIEKLREALSALSPNKSRRTDKKVLTLDRYVPAG